MHTEEIPQVADKDRVKCSELGEGFIRLWPIMASWRRRTCRTVLRALGRAEDNGKPVAVTAGQYDVLSRTGNAHRQHGRRWPSRGVPRMGRRMARWRKKLFIIMTRNAQSATAFFGLPPNRVVELGAQIRF